MVDCETFLAEHSALRDGVVSRETRQALEAHKAVCPSCARYDRVVAGGAALLRDLPEVRPSDDFMQRLQARIREEDQAVASARRAYGSVGTGLAAAAVVAAAAWVPLLKRDGAAAASSGASDAAAPLLPAMSAQPAAEPGLADQLADLGVEVWHTPYADLLRRDLPVAPVATLAAFDASSGASLLK